MANIIQSGGPFQNQLSVKDTITGFLPFYHIYGMCVLNGAVRVVSTLRYHGLCVWWVSVGEGVHIFVSHPLDSVRDWHAQTRKNANNMRTCTECERRTRAHHALTVSDMKHIEVEWLCNFVHNKVTMLLGVLMNTL